MILYRLLSGRMGERPSITRSIINIVGSVVVATLVFWIIKMLTGVTGVYSPLLVFFLILFLILFLFGISTFANIVENIMTSLLTIIIGAVITLIAFFVIDKLVDTSSFIQQLANPLVFTNVTLTIASIILISIIYQMTTKIGWFMSFVRSLIAVIVSCSLLILVQKLFSMSNILATVGIFHVFLAIVLFLLGMRNTENKVIYIAQVSRVTVLHLAIMFIVFLVVKGFLV